MGQMKIKNRASVRLAKNILGESGVFEPLRINFRQFLKIAGSFVRKLDITVFSSPIGAGFRVLVGAVK
jgi:hypothetical protein